MNWRHKCIQNNILKEIPPRYNSIGLCERELTKFTMAFSFSIDFLLFLDFLH